MGLSSVGWQPLSIESGSVMEYGYCQPCNKEVGIEGEVLERHYAMALTGHHDNCARVVCGGSYHKPWPTPETGDTESRQLHNSPPVDDKREQYSALYNSIRQHVDGQTYHPVQPHNRGLLTHLEVDGVDISEHVIEFTVDYASFTGGLDSYSGDPATAFTAAGVRVEEPVYWGIEYELPSFEPRTATYSIRQRDAHGTMGEPIDVTRLINHYQGRVDVVAHADGNSYLSFT